MLFKKLTLLCSLLFAVHLGVYSQSSQGTDFWVAFLQNCDVFNEPTLDFYKLEVTVAAKNACTVHVDNDDLGFHKSLVMEPNSTQIFEVPYDEFNLNVYGEVTNKTLHVTSTDTISLYLSNSQHCSMECTLALPTSVWGSYYVTQTSRIRVSDSYYKFHPAVFAVIASEDGTEVEITPTLKTGDGHPANVPFVVTLNKGEVYAVESTSADEGKDLSGSQIRVKDGKKVQVFMGNRSVNVPEPNPAGDADNLWEVCYPVSSWGQKFVIVPLKTGKNDLVKCTAADQGAVLYKDGVKIAEVEPFASYDFIINEEDGALILESSKPVEVYQYLTSSRYPRIPRTKGGPSFQYVAPVEQAIPEVTFATFNTHEIENHYLNVVIKASDKDKVTLDGKTHFATFSELTGDSNLLFASISIEAGSHVLMAPNGVVANMFGTGYQISYAYSAGSRMGAINASAGNYIVRYDGNGATEGSMDSHVFTIGVDETTRLDANAFIRSYNVSFDTDGGEELGGEKVYCLFQGWLHERLLTEITQDMEPNWNTISTRGNVSTVDLHLVKLSTEDGVNSVSFTTEGSTRERLYSQPIYMPAGDYDLSFNVCSPTGYRDLEPIWVDSFKCSACGQPQQIYCNDLGLLTKGEEKSAVVINCQTASEKMVERQFTIFANDTTPVYIAINGGNLEDRHTYRFKFSDFVLSKDGSTSLTYNDKELTKNIVRENGGIVDLKAIWKPGSLTLPLPKKEGSLFKGWNTKSDGSGLTYQANDKIVVDSDVDLYAMWQEDGRSSERNEIEIPTAFTPHFNDGMNDVFMKGYEVYIYDRYGNLITHSYDGWDGHYRGKVATAGVYVYVLFDGGEQIKGTIEIVKAK